MEKIIKHFVIKNKTVSDDISHTHVILCDYDGEKVVYIERHGLTKLEPEFDQIVLKEFKGEKVLMSRFAIRISTLTTIYNELIK